MRDFYEILGVSKNASDQEIKTSYRKQALKWHPDRNKTTEATSKFKEINKAYEVLSDSKKRQMYDQVGPEAFDRAGGGGASAGRSGAYSYQQGPFSYTYSSSGGNPFEGFDFGGFSDPFEIFEQFFGFQSPFSQGSRRANPVGQITISFEEAVKGVQKEVSLDGKTRSVKIPAGVDDGTRIRFQDFDVVLRVRPHSQFRREGQDIYLELAISYPEAVMGGVVEVPTIEGKVRLKIKGGTKSGMMLRLQGKGVPSPNTGRRGDQYVIFTIKVPERVSGRTKKLLEDLQKELS